MGCKQSKQVQVQPVGALEMKNAQRKNQELEIDDNTRKHNKRSKSTKSAKSMGSCDSLDDDRSLESDRGGSAGSKKSNDSGMGDDNGEDNQGFITEYSDPDKVHEVEAGFKEREDLELGITGTQLNTRNSAKDKARLEESMILQSLREEGLISKTVGEKSGGISFDIMDANNGSKLPALPPLKLAKLERRRKKKREPLTEEQIEEKLKRAEHRRKKKEQMRLEKIKDLDKADQTAALESFKDYQKKKEEQVVQKMESVSDNRERRLREVKEKQLERERKREEVRRRKRERMENGELHENDNTGEIVRDTSELLLDREETPMVPE